MKVSFMIFVFISGGDRRIPVLCWLSVFFTGGTFEKGVIGCFSPHDIMGFYVCRVLFIRVASLRAHQ